MENKGFTIIELMISIFVLTIGVIGVYSAFSIMTILTSDAADRLTGAYLAQEGMEIVRNIRDNNWIAGNDWGAGLADNSFCTDANVGCEADYTTMGTADSPLSSYGTSGDYLNIDTNGFYSYNGGQKTKFKRKIIITSVTDANGATDHIINVKVEVFWDEKANILNPTGGLAGNPNSGSITAEEYLYNWY